MAKKASGKDYAVFKLEGLWWVLLSSIVGRISYKDLDHNMLQPNLASPILVGYKSGTSAFVRRR
jgi:hypothetical protein